MPTGTNGLSRHEHLRVKIEETTDLLNEEELEWARELLSEEDWRWYWNSRRFSLPEEPSA